MRITKHFISVLIILGICSSEIYSQQGIELPRRSPKASVSYTIGYTNVNVSYSAPALQERTIWGELVPYDEVWRAGANEATTIEFSTDVVLEGENLPAGKYAFFLIPKESGNWTAILNTESDQWGAYGHDESKDVLRVEVEPKFSRSVSEDRLSYSITDFDIDKGYIRLGWEKLRLYLRFNTDAVEVAQMKIDEALNSGAEEEKWVVYAQAADFLMQSEDKLDKAMEMAEKSTSLHSSSWNWWIKAQVHKAKGDIEGAIQSAEKALEAGAAAEEDGFYMAMKEVIKSSRDQWEDQM